VFFTRMERKGVALSIKGGSPTVEINSISYNPEKAVCLHRPREGSPAVASPPPLALDFID